MKLNSFSPLPEDDEELHLPELVYWASQGDVEQVEQLLAEGIDPNQTDDDGYSALQAAAENKLLLKPLRELMPYHWSIVNGVQL